MDVRTATGEKFVLERAINRGGEAQIWTVHQDPHLVAKLYHKPTPEHQAKLTTMLAAPLTRKRSHPTVAWPLQLLYRQHHFIGYLMPRAAGSLPLFHYYNPARRRRLGLPHAWPRFLHRTATNLAAAVELVHAHHHVIGDLNESNALVTQSALVTLVDTDSFQISTGQGAATRVPTWLGTLQTRQTYRCGVGKAEYTAPELQGVDFKSIDRTPYHDNFALAVLIFYLLMDGFHPFAGVLTSGASVGRVDLYGIKQGFFPYLSWGGNNRNLMQPPPNAPAFAHLHPGLQDAFRRTFVDGHAHPERRVTAKEWKKLLHEAEVALVPCPQNTAHLYSRHLGSCPTCLPTVAKQRPNSRPKNEIQTTVATSSRRVGELSALFKNLSASRVPAAWLIASQTVKHLAKPSVTLPQLVAARQQIQGHLKTYAKTTQSAIATLPDRFATAKHIVTTHADLFGSWLLGNVTGTPLAALAAVGGYALLPQLLQLTALSPQGQVMLVGMLFAALFGGCQGYALRRSLLSQPYLRHAWVGVTTVSGAVMGAVAFRLLGPDWHQVDTWHAHSLTVTTLAALFGLVLGYLQSLLLRQYLRLADDGRIWTIVNGINGVLTAQGWLWGQSFPYTWSITEIPDWQLNAGGGALIGVALGSLLSGSVLLWMVQGPRRSFYLRQFALGLLRWPLTPTRLRKGTVRWVRALLLLILVWFFLQVVAQLNGAAALVAPPVPTGFVPQVAPTAIKSP
ncbi:MAG: hypothetical protein R3E79_25805 [Caldilineaceae bacterium]